MKITDGNGNLDVFNIDSIYACSENHIAFSCILPQLLFFYHRKLYGNRFFQNSNVENVGLKSRVSLGHTHF